MDCGFPSRRDGRGDGQDGRRRVSCYVGGLVLAAGDRGGGRGGAAQRNAPQPELGGVSCFTGRTWKARWPLFGFDGVDCRPVA